MSYDISDDKRRDKVYKMLFGYGDHAQYSVFFCSRWLRGDVPEYIGVTTR